MTALGNVITWQRLDYDFDFHKQAFPTDVVALVLSEGKSMLTVSVFHSSHCISFIPLYFIHSIVFHSSHLFLQKTHHIFWEISRKCVLYVCDVCFVSYSLDEAPFLQG